MIVLHIKGQPVYIPRRFFDICPTAQQLPMEDFASLVPKMKDRASFQYMALRGYAKAMFVQSGPAHGLGSLHGRFFELMYSTISMQRRCTLKIFLDSSKDYG